MQGREDKVTGHRSADGDFGGLKVTNFTDHHDVRVLAENRAEAIREREADFRLNVDLAHPGKAILDRLFDRDDAARRLVDRRQKAVERRALAGTGRAGDEDDSVRLLQKFLYCGNL